MADRIGKPISQRQLRVGEMIKQSLSMIFLRNEAKVPNLETNTITVTEVRMSQDLKIAKAYVLPLGGKDAEESIFVFFKYSNNFFLLLTALNNPTDECLSFLNCLMCLERVSIFSVNKAICISEDPVSLSCIANSLTFLLMSCFPIYLFV